MQKVDKDKFLFLYTNQFSKEELSDLQKSGITFLLDQLMLDDKVSDIRWAAYMLATIKRECAGHWQPISEFGKGLGKPYGKPGSNGKIFYGRGYVQLTWEDNYKTMGKTLGIDLFNQPDLAKDPAVAYSIMSIGMRKGLFTGVGLLKYINDAKCDYRNARRIINGTDCAEQIAEWAEQIEGILRACVVEP